MVVDYTYASDSVDFRIANSIRSRFRSSSVYLYIILIELDCGISHTENFRKIHCPIGCESIELNKSEIYYRNAYSMFYINEKNSDNRQ